MMHGITILGKGNSTTVSIGKTMRLLRSGKVFTLDRDRIKYLGNGKFSYSFEHEGKVYHDVRPQKDIKNLLKSNSYLTLSEVD